jgi:hypothetical protein
MKCFLHNISLPSCEDFCLKTQQSPPIAIGWLDGWDHGVCTVQVWGYHKVKPRLIRLTYVCLDVWTTLAHAQAVRISYTSGWYATCVLHGYSSWDTNHTVLPKLKARPLIIIQQPSGILWAKNKDQRPPSNLHQRSSNLPKEWKELDNQQKLSILKRVLAWDKVHITIEMHHRAATMSGSL